MNKERGRGAETVRDLERKLKDLQDKLHNMMQEANADKDQSLRLRNEINVSGCLFHSSDYILTPFSRRNETIIVAGFC